MKRLIILGSTGSIGTQTLEVAENLQWPIVALTAGKNIDLLEKQIRKYRPQAAAMTDPQAALALRRRISDLPTVILDSISDILKNFECDTVVNGISGMAGTLPTVQAIEAGRDIVLANKESIVTAGEHILDLARKKGIHLISADSEHSAIQQCIDGSQNKIKRILLTASGGPFFGKTAEQLQSVTKTEALRHPNWSMGAKITLDSATLMNKGLELIEAVRLFDVHPEQVKVIIHRESIVHSAVEFEDNAVLAQLGTADMRTPIQYALTYPMRVKSPAESLDLIQLGRLTFFEPDRKTFRALSLAESAVREGGTAPTILNAANEVAVQKFLNDRLSFTGITTYVEQVLEKTPVIHSPTLAQIFETDAKIRADQ